MPGHVSPPDPPTPRWAAIDESLLEDVYAADQAIYPAPLLTYQRLSSWAAACPDLCICLRDGQGRGPARGVMIVLPLREACWARLVAGELGEHHVEPAAMFPPSAAGPAAVRVGLHVFHVERYAPSAAGFARDALEQVRSRVRQRFPSWSVVGYSALTATSQGNSVFKRLGFTSRFTETKADGDEAEMLVLQGNETFVPS